MPDQNDIIFNQYSLDWSGFISAILRFFTDSAPTASEVAAFFNTVWFTLFAVSMLLAALFFVGFVYAAIRYNQLAEEELEGIKDQERLYQQLFGNNQPTRFDDIKQHITSDNPNDWKLAIIEADIELERVLEAAGYPGATIGDKLKSANHESFTTLRDAWDAHMVRNKVAHEGADFVLTKKIAQETIVKYQRVFTEFGHR